MKVRVIKPVSIAPDINVTPLIDVVLVLLIIFMVITPLLHDDIAVQIPDVEQVETPTEVPPDQLVVRVHASGDLSLNDAPLDVARWREQLRARLVTSRERVVFVTADARASYELVVRVLDGARREGARVLGLTTTPADAATSADNAAPDLNEP